MCCYLNQSISYKVVYILITLKFNVTFSCSWNNFCPYGFFSAKTPYNHARGDIRDSVFLKDCKAISIWGLFRHGQRTPGIKPSENIENVITIRDHIISRHQEGKGSLCAQDVEDLRNWKINKSDFDKNDTLNDGIYELTAVGKRFKEAFQKLLTNLTDEECSFRSSKLPYIRSCVDSFVKGIGQPELSVESLNSDDVMSPDECKRYIEFVKRNETTFAEARRYLNTTDYLKSKWRIQNRLALDFQLTNENITFLYNLCRYTWLTVENKPSPWCAVFDREDMKVQEYYGDLAAYYRDGYGHPWNIEFGQTMLADLHRTFEVEKNIPCKRITAFFTRSSVLSMTYSALGQFKDEHPLTADYRDDNREWRTSKHSTFAANLVAVLNKCNKKSKNEYVVAFYMNENPLRSICDQGVCTWQEFEETMRPFENKTFESICNKNIL